MFDSHTYVKMVTNQNHYNTISFQQVSGSLLKSHADSIFVRFDKGSPMEKEIFSNVPRMNVRVGWQKDYSCSYYETKYKPKIEEREVTVLQVLLAHDSSYVCEVVVHYQKGDEQYTEEKKESHKDD